MYTLIIDKKEVVTNLTAINVKEDKVFVGRRDEPLEELRDYMDGKGHSIQLKRNSSGQILESFDSCMFEYEERRYSERMDATFTIRIET